LIECPAEAFKDKLDNDLPLPPATPDNIDKENVSMSEIIPHIFVGTYALEVEVSNETIAEWQQRTKNETDEKRLRKMHCLNNESRFKQRIFDAAKIRLRKKGQRNLSSRNPKVITT
jgi:hypothetical protein